MLAEAEKFYYPTGERVTRCLSQSRAQLPAWPVQRTVVGAFPRKVGLFRTGSMQSRYFQHELESLNHLSGQLFLRLEEGGNPSRC